jgi:hypothetical protein
MQFLTRFAIRALVFAFFIAMAPVAIVALTLWVAGCVGFVFVDVGAQLVTGKHLNGKLPQYASRPCYQPTASAN